MALPIVVPGSTQAPSVGGRGTPRVANTAPVTSGAWGAAAETAIKWADAAWDIVERDQQLARATRVAKEVADYTSVLDKKKLELNDDPDIATRSDRFKSFAQEEWTKRRAGMDKETLAKFDIHSTQLAQAAELDVRHQARRDTKDEAVVTLRATNDQLVKRAGEATNAADREATLNVIKTNIDTALSTNILSPAQHKRELAATLVKADEATALRMIRGNPGQAATVLGKSDVLPNLDPVSRERLIDRANNESRARLSQALALEARQERIEAKIAAKYQDQNGKELEALAADGKLTRDWLETNRPQLSKSDYTIGLKIVKGGSLVDDRDAVIDATNRLDTPDASKLIDNYYLNDKLTKPTYDSLKNRNRELLKDDGPPSPYKRGYSMVRDTLAPGTQFDTSSAKIAMYSQTQAINEFDTFAQANRDAILKNPELATEKANDIIRRYRQINFEQIGQAVGLPSGYGGTREDIQTADIEAAGKRILQLFDQGRLSKAEKDLELRRLEQWDAIIKQRDAANAEAAQRGRGRTPPAQGSEGRR